MTGGSLYTGGFSTLTVSMAVLGVSSSPSLIQLADQGDSLSR